MKKDTKSWERTERSIATKALNTFGVFKTNWFLSAKRGKRSEEGGEKTEICEALNPRSLAASAARRDRSQICGVGAGLALPEGTPRGAPTQGARGFGN